MPTLYGNWVGGSTNGRIVCVYSVSYTADRTQAIYTGTLYVETDQFTTDSVNTWLVSGDDGVHSGSNIPISFGSGGGIKAFYSNFSFQKYGDGVIGARVSNVEAVGVDITASFTMDSGALAPYLTSGYSAVGIGQTGFTITGVHAAANGGVLNGMQLEVNTAANDTGALYFTTGTFTNPVATGLTPNKLYYYRLRVKNSTYGYSAWGPWLTVQTTSTVPGTFPDSFEFGSVGPEEFTIGNLVYPDNGGVAIDWVTVTINTIPGDSGAISTDHAGTPSSIVKTGLIPGTTYFVKLTAHNVNGFGVSSNWKAVTTLPGVYVDVAGTWKTATIFVNVGGIWKPATRWVCVSPGVWRQ